MTDGDKRIKEIEYKSQLKTARFMLDNFNKEIKRLSSMCYIGHDGLFYLKSENTKMERIGMMAQDDQSMQVLFEGVMYDTLDLHEFSKDYRFSTSTVYYDSDKVVIGQTEKAKVPDAKFEFNIVCDQSEIIQEDTLNHIKGEFYKRFFEVLEKEGIDPIELDHLDTIEISKELKESLMQNSLIRVVDDRYGETIHAYITKALFPNIAHCSSLSYVGLKTRGVYDDKCAYFIFKEYNDVANIIVFTLIAAYQNV